MGPDSRLSLSLEHTRVCKSAMNGDQEEDISTFHSVMDGTLNRGEDFHILILFS